MRKFVLAHKINHKQVQLMPPTFYIGDDIIHIDIMGLIKINIK